MMYFILTLNLILTIINIFILYLILNEKKNNDYIDAEDIMVLPDIDTYIHSLEFNMKLDEMIKPLLDTYSDNDIISRVYSKLILSDPVCKNMEDKQELKEYLKEVLKSYDNYYQEESIDIPAISIDEKYQLNKKIIDLSHTLQNFYND